MRNLFLTILIIFLTNFYSNSLSACFCSGFQSTSEKINQSSYIALVRIIGFVSMGTHQKYKIITQEINLYKGSSKKEIIVAGSNKAVDSNYITSCDMNLAKSAEWLIFGDEINGEVYTDYCKGSILYKDQSGYRGVFFSDQINCINEINDFFKKPRIEFVKEKGRLKTYYPNRSIEMIENFEHGMREGVRKTFYPDGSLEGEQVFKRGKLNGTSKYYLRTGTLAKIAHYENALEIDSTNEYFYNKDSAKSYLKNTVFRNKKGIVLSSKNYNQPLLLKYTPSDYLLKANAYYLSSEYFYDSVKDETTHIWYHPNGRPREIYKLNSKREYIGDIVKYDEDVYVIKILRMEKNGEKGKIIYIDKTVWPNYKEEF